MRRDYIQVVHNVKRIFRSKPDLMTPLLCQLNRSLILQGVKSTLSTVFIHDYVHYDRDDLVIICWNGEMDFKIIKN